MKMLRMSILGVLVSLLILSCSKPVSKNLDNLLSPGRQKLERLPEIGDKYSAISKSQHLLITRSGQISPAYEIEVEQIEYTITVNEDSCVNSISTNDSTFFSPESLQIGSTLKEVQEMTDNPVYREVGWAFVVELRGDWQAAFTQGPSMTEGVLRENAEVKFFIKR